MISVLTCYANVFKHNLYSVAEKVITMDEEKRYAGIWFKFDLSMIARSMWPTLTVTATSS